MMYKYVPYPLPPSWSMSADNLLSFDRSLGCLNHANFFMFNEFGSCIVLKYGAKLHIIIDV